MYKCKYCNNGYIDIFVKRIKDSFSFEIIKDYSLINDNKYEFLYYVCECIICKGTGKIDWIDNIFQENFNIEYVLHESLKNYSRKTMNINHFIQKGKR